MADAQLKYQEWTAHVRVAHPGIRFTNAVLKVCLPTRASSSSMWAAAPFLHQIRCLYLCLAPLTLTHLLAKAVPLSLSSMADKQYMDEQGIEKALSVALAQVIREKPPNALKRIAQLISPETFVDPDAPPPAPPAAAPGAEPAAATDAPPPPPEGAPPAEATAPAATPAAAPVAAPAEA